MTDHARAPGAHHRGITLMLGTAAGARPAYVGRDEAAAPASGLLAKHDEGQRKLVDEALTL